MDATHIRLEIYKEQEEKLKTYVEHKWDTLALKNFHFLSANLSKCLPDIPMSTHKYMYRKILSFRALQSIDTRFYQNFNSVKGVDDFSEKIKNIKNPGIFVSYHLGSFRSALALLIKANIDVVLIIDPLPYELQKDHIIEQYKQVKAHFNSTSDLIIFPADKKDLSVQILAKTSKNYSVLAFVDGNTGYNGAFNQKNTVKVDFLGQKVAFRRGLAMLSYFTKCPMYPMLSYYDEHLKPHWEILDPIYPDAEMKADDFADQTIKKLFGILEKALIQYPDQWEGWLYLHKFMDIDSFDTPAASIDMNDHDTFYLNPKVGIFSYEDRYYALNKENYKIVELTKALFERLHFDKKVDQLSDEDRADIAFLVEKRFVLKEPNLVVA